MAQRICTAKTNQTNIGPNAKHANFGAVVALGYLPLSAVVAIRNYRNFAQFLCIKKAANFGIKSE